MIPSQYVTFLVLHIVFGSLGVIASYAVWMGLLKKQLKLPALMHNSVSAVIFYLLSWILGGIYYVNFYGGQVKPTIKQGPYPWAHAIFTETKEHIFLFLPFLAFILWLGVRSLGDTEESDGSIQKPLVWLAAVTTFIGVATVLFGALISGGYRP